MRRLGKILGLVLAVVLAGIVTLPFWLGLVLGGVGRALHATYGSYERLGYARFALHEVEVMRADVNVRVGRVEAATPALWLWLRLTHHPDEIVATHWEVVVNHSEPHASPIPVSPGGWVPLRGRLRRIAAQLGHWLPRAQLGSGSVQWTEGGLKLNSAVWSGRALTVVGLMPVAKVEVARLARPSGKAGAVDATAGISKWSWLTTDLTATFPVDADAIRVAARAPDLDVNAVFESREAGINGEIHWAEQRATARARFNSEGWLPATIEAQADNWKIPGARLKLDEAYSLVHGSGRVDWHDGKIVAELVATGDPVPGKSAPPLDVQVRGRGTTAEFTVETMRVTLPGINAQLTQPVTVDRDGHVKTGTAQFTLDANLARQPWFKAAGSVRGSIRLAPGEAAIPTGDFDLTAHDVTVADWSFASFETKGKFVWPRVELNSGTLAPATGERLEFHGGWNFQTKEVLDAAVSGQILRATLARWWPTLPAFDRLAVEAKGAGPLSALAHSGQVKVERVAVSGLKPFALDAAWQGKGAMIENLTAEASAGATKLAIAGSMNRTSIHLTKIALAQQAAERVHLREPMMVRWQPDLQVDALHLVGPEGSIDAAFEWGQKGQIDAAVSGVASTWFADLLALQGPAWDVKSVMLKGNWDHGPMNYAVQGSALIHLSASRQADLTVSAKGDNEGVQIDTLRAAEGPNPIFGAKGRIGFVVTPLQSPLVHITPETPLNLEAETEPNAVFWEQLKELTGVELKDPRVTARLSGTWAKPQGEVGLEAARLAIEPTRFTRPFPTVEQLKLHLTGDLEGVNLDTFSVAVDGQAIKASGRLRVKDGRWGDLFKDPLTVARRDTDLQIEIPDAQLAPLTRYLPDLLAPQGRLQADLKFSAGGSWDGKLQVREAVSRPLGPLGVLQEISADVRLTGTTLVIESLSAKAAGQPLTLSGKVELPLGGVPHYDLSLKGENLPFVRQTGLLIRGDLDIKLANAGADIPVVSGAVVLHDSLYLADVRALIPGGPRGGSRRPPYFSVNVPPVNAWRLAIDVKGERFIRLRTTVFTGVASAHFQLSGTLGDPRALGEATIDEGQVLLPFANFEVQQGHASLTQAQPFEPQLFISGTARRYGYDVRMELNGDASNPNLTFTSSPPLDSRQVLLMVMAGETPQNEITYTVNQRFARIGTFLGQSLLNNLGGDAGSSDRLSVSTGENVSAEGRETYDIEYRLSKRWSLVGEYDEFDDFNAGVKWRVYSKGGRENEEKK